VNRENARRPHGNMKKQDEEREIERGRERDKE